MRYLKTTDLITLLPIDNGLKTSLNNKLLNVGNEERLDYEQLLWSVFSEYKEKLENIYYQEMFIEAEQNKRELTAGLMQRAKKRAAEEFENVLSGKKQELQEVDEIRSKLQTLITAKN